MKILTAIDSFKGSMSSQQANQMVVNALPNHEVQTFTVADGGEGTIDAFTEVLNGEIETEVVTGLLGKSLTVRYGWVASSKLVVLEAAESAGITKVSMGQLHPKSVTTYGLGEQLLAAAQRGAREIIIGLGGSATVDGGVGLLQALGVRFYDQKQALLPVLPIDLAKIARIDCSQLTRELQHVQIHLAVDVTNPLCGPNGAVTIFGPQKGLAPEELTAAEMAMQEYQQLVNQVTQTHMEDCSGSGAAGGLAFALRSFFPVKVSSGLALLAERGRLDEKIAQVDCVITGEGKFDHQSLQGKVPVGVSRIARSYQVPVLVFAGTIEEGMLNVPEEHIAAIFPIVDTPMSLQEAMAQGPNLLFRAIQRVFHLLEIFSNTP